MEEEPSKVKKSRLKKEKQMLKKGIDKFVGKEIQGYIDEIHYELDFTFYFPSIKKSYRGQLQGTMIPIINKEHITRAKNYMSKHLYQRETAYKVVSYNSQNHQIEVEEADLGSEESVTGKMFRRGYMKIKQESMMDLDQVYLMNLRSLQRVGQAGQKGI